MMNLLELNKENRFWNIPEYELKKAVICDKVNPLLIKYVKYQYDIDLQNIVIKLLKYIKQLEIHSNSIIIIDLDETFLQNADFYPHTLELWCPTMQQVYAKTGKRDIGGILPYMSILYFYLIHKKIKVVFLTGRKETLRNITKLNLQMFGICDYDLFMTPLNTCSTLYKNYIVEQFRTHDIVAILNDQDEITHDKLVKFPQLYTV